MKKYIYLSLGFFIVASFFSVGYFHPDEHFQILEFAAYKAGKIPASSLPWEFAAGMRSGLQPFIAFYIIKFLALIKIVNPFYQVFFLRLFSGMINFFTILYLYKGLRKKDSLRLFKEPVFVKGYVLLAFLSWYIFFLGVRFSSESYGMALIALGVAFWLNNKPLWLVGLIMGFGFLCRFQTAFMIAGFGLYLIIIEQKHKQAIHFATGLLAAFLMGCMIDHWLYDHWVLPAYNYFFQNIVAGKAATFGTYPWYFYIVRTLGFAIPPYSIFLIVCVFAFFYFYPKHWVSFILIPFLLAHFIVAHKEMRFIFSVLHFLPFVIIAVLVKIKEDPAYKKVHRFLSAASKWALPLMITVNCILLCITSFTTINFSIPAQQYFWNNYKSGDIIYCLQKSPYTEGDATTTFYQKNSIDIHILTSDSLLPNHDITKTVFVVARPDYIFSNPDKYILCYQSLPGWIVKYMNFNHWVERSATWRIYKQGP